MTDQRTENNRPSNVGDDSNLPPDVRAVAGLQSSVVAWTTEDKDPKYERDGAAIRRMACVIACFPLFLFTAKNPKHSHTYWILTETELKFVTLNHEVCFLPGIKQSGDTVHTIPLDNITGCGVKTSHWWWSFPYIYVKVPESIDDDYGRIDWTHTIVGLALAGQNWFAQEIMRRRNTLNATVGTIGSVSIPLPSTSKYGLSARFGNEDNAPDSLLRWAQQGRFHIVAWTTFKPPKTPGTCIFMLLHLFAWYYPLVAVSLSSPVISYMLARFFNGHSLLPFPVAVVAGSVYAGLLLIYALDTYCASKKLQDRYWVVTETDLFVLHTPCSRLDINRKIPLLSISRCLFITTGQGLLDRWGASLPLVFIGTTGKEKLEFSIWGLALAENEWFLQQVLNQRNRERSDVIEVFA
jgi:hypothetical protein